MQRKEIIEIHWRELKGAIRSQWDTLTDKDLEGCKENLTDLFKEDLTCQELLEEIITSFDFKDDLLTPPDEEFYEEHQTAPRSSEVSEFQDDSRDIRTRCPERKKFEENIRAD